MHGDAYLAIFCRASRVGDDFHSLLSPHKHCHKLLEYHHVQKTHEHMKTNQTCSLLAPQFLKSGRSHAGRQSRQANCSCNQTMPSKERTREIKVRPWPLSWRREQTRIVTSNWDGDGRKMIWKIIVCNCKSHVGFRWFQLTFQELFGFKLSMGCVQFVYPLVN
jgi:hypothetical protein